ncbi:MAG: peptidoglycan DD-metalloendopeptidase family protein [Lachnospiraceae bacterium]|nr:peptidoglycan DD-metalloendopeptidase family protein [Lachnospiraceae bacterium]
MPKERKMEMKKDNRNNNARRERFIMISTSALVLTALTVTGAYVRTHNRNALDHGYTIDFEALEDRADEKLKEIALNSGKGRVNLQGEAKEEMELPLEAGSDEIKIPGLTEKNQGSFGADQSSSKGMSDGAGTLGSGKSNAGKQTNDRTGVGKQVNDKTGVGTQGSSKTTAGTSDAGKQESAKAVINHETESGAGTLNQAESLVTDAAPVSAAASEELHFVPETMVKPVGGNPLIPYSMEHGVYFATLDQYKCSPAVVYGASLGEAVSACTTGRVINVHNDAELGHVVVLDLGDGYQAIYGQVDNIGVPIGTKIDAGAQLATVAEPTKYYSVEGSNLYFQLKKDGESIDPSQFFE